MSLKRTLKVAAPLAALAVATLHGQVGRGSTEWLTAGGDAQRTFWVRTDPKISVASLSAPGFDLQWTATLENGRRGAGLMHGVTANGVTLFVPMSLVAGGANTIYALDNDLGHVVWTRQFDAALPAATAQCPGGITAGATRIVPLEPAPITFALAGLTAPGGRAGQSYRSVIGEPGQGVPLEGRGGRGPGAGAPATPAGQAGLGLGAQQPPAGRGAPGTPTPPAAAAPGAAPGPQRGGGGGGGGGRGQGGAIPGAPAEQGGGRGGGLGRPSGVVYAVSGDGMLHVLGLQSGKDLQRPAQFIPANARWTDTIAVNTTLYAATTDSCAGAPNAIWAIDLDSESKPVVSWKTNGGPIVGRVAFATGGTLFAAVGPGTATGDGKTNAIVALDPKTLQIKDWFTKAGVEFATGPAVFTHEGRDVVAAATKDGRVVLLNAASLGGADHGTALHTSSPVLATGGSVAANALATWQELTVAAPDAPSATPAPTTTSGPPAGPPQGAAQAPAQPIVTTGARWIVVPTATGLASLKVGGSGGSLSLERGWTANVPSPATPIVVNGVVFGLARGRAASPAVLHAFDGKTGKQLWTSARAMKAAAAPESFWSALSQIYVGTTDGTLYAFGFLDERR